MTLLLEEPECLRTVNEVRLGRKRKCDKAGKKKRELVKYGGEREKSNKNMWKGNQGKDIDKKSQIAGNVRERKGLTNKRMRRKISGNRKIRKG